MTRRIVTRGLVLGKRGVGEANTLVAILTQEYGLLKASAKSARREASKLRYGLEPMTQGRFSFVEGAYEWKLVGAQDLARRAAPGPRNAAAAGRIARLLLRLVRGEERASSLYRAVEDGMTLLFCAREREEIESLECVLVLRILFHLGYLPETPELAPFVADHEVSLELAAQAAARRSALIRAINESLFATGL